MVARGEVTEYVRPNSFGIDSFVVHEVDIA